MKRIYIPAGAVTPSGNHNTKRPSLPSTTVLASLLIAAFCFGCILTASFVLHLQIDRGAGGSGHGVGSGAWPPTPPRPLQAEPPEFAKNGVPTSNSLSTTTILQGVRILVAIAAFDFAQIPHLEEVLDAYHDVAVAGAATVDVVIHATVAYPVTLIDLWNTRFDAPNFTVTIILKPKQLRLHLVDCHRELFYERLDQYDLFIYTEDDIRVRPTTVATYLSETRRIEQMLQSDKTTQLRPSHFNVGIVRYEYNFPTNVIMDDNTRHATQNVTRVYWEHSSFTRPVVPNAVSVVPQAPLAARYVTMQNHHQGMYLATRALLVAWRDLPNCHFDQIRDRPGRGSQPTEGTQRVWMSSQMLYGGRHCNVQQVLPRTAFGALTVLHLPNKNYRRVGKYRARKFADGTETFEQPHASLLTAMELHVGMVAALPKSTPQHPYAGIRMVDEVAVGRTPLLERRLAEYAAYVQRGGVLSDDDLTKTELLEPE